MITLICAQLAPLVGFDRLRNGCNVIDGLSPQYKDLDREVLQVRLDARAAFLVTVDAQFLCPYEQRRLASRFHAELDCEAVQLCEAVSALQRGRGK